MLYGSTMNMRKQLLIEIKTKKCLSYIGIEVTIIQTTTKTKFKNTPNKTIK